MQQLKRVLVHPHAILSVAVIGLSFTRLSLIAIIATIALWTYAIQRAFPKQFATGIIGACAIGLLAFFTVNAFIALTGSMASIAIAIPFIVTANCLLILVLATLKRSSAERPNIQVHWWVIAAIVCVIALFAAPVLARPTTANLLNYSAYGYDDAAHIQMYRGDIISKGIITKVDTSNPNLNLDPTIASYPQGIHFNLSVFARSVFQLTHATIENIHEFLLIYRLGLVLLYATIVILMAEATSQIVMRLRGSKEKLGAVAPLSIGATVFIVYNTLIYPEIAYAGQSFLATIAMSIGVMIMLLIADGEEKSLYRRIAFAFAALFAIGTVYTWIVSMLVSFAALIFFAVKEQPLKKILIQIKSALTHPLSSNYKQFAQSNWSWLVITIAGVLSLPQIAILLLRTTTGLNSLNIDGGIGIPDHTRYLVLAAAVLVGVIAFAINTETGRSPKKEVQDILNTVLLFLIPLLLVLFFYIVQTVTTGTLTYYFTKSTYLAYTFLIILIGGLATYAITRIGKVISFSQSLYVAVLIFGILGIFLSAGRGCLVYAHGRNAFVDANLTNHAGKLIDEGVRPRNIISYTGRVYEEDMLFNLITDQLDQYRSPERHIITVLVQQKRYKVFKKFVADYTKRPEKTYILVSKATENDIRRAMPATGNYEIVVINK